MAKYPLFKDVFDTVKAQSKLKGIEWYDEIYDISRNVANIKSGATFTLSKHVEQLTAALLSCQRVWAELEPHFEVDSKNPTLDVPMLQRGKSFLHINEIFMHYDPALLRAANAEETLNSIKSIECGNRRINSQISSLLNQPYTRQYTHPKTKVKSTKQYQGNILDILERFNNDPDYDFLDFKHGYRAFTEDSSGEPIKQNIIDLVTLLSQGTVSKNSVIKKHLSSKKISECKMQEMGAALVCEYLKGFGISVVKPDVHVCRVLYRLGYIQREDAVKDALNICYDIADYYDAMFKSEFFAAKLPSAVPSAVAVDTVLWQFAARGKLEICIAEDSNKKKVPPRCNLCLALNCPYRK